jgi:phosphate:Na+ symporter
VTGIIAIAFISQFVWAVDIISNQVGIAKDNYTMKLAVFHTLFNLTGVIVMVPLIQRLADYLNKALPETELNMAQPLYLNGAAIEFPETVLKALKKEVWHLFDSAFEIMAHGINLHRTQILESPDLEKTIDEDREIIEFDLDELYESKVKVLYGAIIEFISDSQANMPSIYAEEMFRLRKASSDIVECVKHVKHMRKNASRYMLSDNEHIRDEYNRLRYHISSILREIYRLRGEGDYDHAMAMLELDELKAEIQLEHHQLDERVTDVLRSDQITPMMATSLLNDFNYVDQTSRNLLDTAQALLVSHSDLVAEAALEVVLDKDEIDQVTATTV